MLIRINIGQFPHTCCRTLPDCSPCCFCGGDCGGSWRSGGGRSRSRRGGGSGRGSGRSLPLPSSPHLRAGARLRNPRVGPAGRRTPYRPCRPGCRPGWSSAAGRSPASPAAAAQPVGAVDLVTYETKKYLKQAYKLNILKKKTS